MDNLEKRPYCYYCFEPVDAPGICPECGKDAHASVPPNHLLPGTVLRDRFIVGRALGQDAWGIVYATLDAQTDSFLRIREYFPRGLCERELNGAVTIIAGAEDAFDDGLDEMEASARTQDSSRRRIFFEDNGTGYLVQRKVPEPLYDETDAATNKLTRNLFVLGAVMCVILAGTMIALLNMGKNALDDVRNASQLQTNDSWQAPAAAPTETIRPEDVIPAERPLPTPLPTDSEPQASKKPGKYSTPTPKPLDDDEDGGFADFDGDEYLDPDVAPDPTPVRNYKRASAEQIAALQERLMELAWLDYDEPTGKYDPPTRQAILDFQQYVNKEYRAGLVADSDCGPATSDWLFDVDAPSRPLPTLKPTKKPTPTPKPTPSPTPKPTPTPTPTPKPPKPSADPTQAPTPTPTAPQPTDPPVTQPPETAPPATEPPATEPPAATNPPESADTESDTDLSAKGGDADPTIAEAMQLLFELSWLDAPEDEDGISTAAYTEALKAFQRAANAQMGLNLNEDGLLDQATMNCLTSAEAPIHMTPVN